MNIEIRYQSRNGNTKAVAETIAKAAGISAESIEKPVDKPVDLLIVGGGIYGWGIDPVLKKFLENLDANTVKSVAAFTTAGVMNKTNSILSIAKSKGLKAEKETLSVKVGLNNHAWLGGKGSIKLSEKQIGKINGFVKRLLQN